MKRKTAIEIICFLFILLFTYAAVTKLLDYKLFVVQLGKSPLLTHFAGVVAWAVPVVELIIVGMLAVLRYRQIALYASFTLMTLFTAYIVAILQLDSNIPCSCGGVLESMGWYEHLVFNSVFVVLAATAVLLNSGEHRKVPPDDPAPSVGESEQGMEKRFADAV